MAQLFRLCEKLIDQDLKLAALSRVFAANEEKCRVGPHIDFDWPHHEPVLQHQLERQVPAQCDTLASNGSLARKNVIVKHSPTVDFDLTPAGQFESFLPGYSFTEIVDEMQQLVLFEICQLLHGLLGCEIGR